LKHDNPTRAEYSATCRALASLARKGLVDTDGTRRWGVLEAVQKQRRKQLRINATHSHSHADRGDDAYFTHPVAVHVLYCLERPYLPRRIWEPAAGEGAIVNVLRGCGYEVTASDKADYGLEGCLKLDYLTAALMPGIEAAVSNPPYRRAVAFIRKALVEVPYVAMLLRTNFLECAWVAANAIILSREDAVVIRDTKWAGRRFEESLQLPAVRNLVAQSRAVRRGLLWVMAGSGVQVVAAFCWVVRMTMDRD
jgi:hypothetical protein